MKFLIVLLVAILAFAAAQGPARPTPAKGDFRNEFDHMLVSTTVERYHQMEEFLLKLSEEVAALEKDHKAEEKERIMRQITITEGFIKGSYGVFERELQRTDLNILERFNFEMAMSTGKILEKDLAALAKRVEAISAH